MAITTIKSWIFLIICEKCKVSVINCHFSMRERHGVKQSENGVYSQKRTCQSRACCFVLMGSAKECFLTSVSSHTTWQDQGSSRGEWSGSKNITCVTSKLEVFWNCRMGEMVGAVCKVGTGFLVDMRTGIKREVNVAGDCGLIENKQQMESCGKSVGGWRSSGDYGSLPNEKSIFKC